MTPFEQSLQQFQTWATDQNPAMGADVSRIISAQYVSQLSGLGYTTNLDSVIENSLAASAPVSTVEKLASYFESAGKTYLSAATAYYQGKGMLADLKLQAKGNAFTQAIDATRKIGGENTSNTLFIVGGALLALYLVTRK
jgi:hypothetical protein